MLSICIISAEKSILVFSFRFPSFSLYSQHTAVLSEIKTLLLPRLTAACVSLYPSEQFSQKFPTSFFGCSVFTKIDAIAVPKPISFRENSTRNFLFVNLVQLFCESFVKNDKIFFYSLSFLDSMKRILAEFFCTFLHAIFAPCMHILHHMQKLIAHAIFFCIRRMIFFA